MANLLVEIGNTALKAAWTEGKTLGKTIRYQGEKMVGFILKYLEEEKPETMLVASVRDLSEEEVALFEANCGRLILLDRNHRDILRAYGLPDYLGYDRAAAIIAVRELFRGKPCLVFDFGTTLSVDSVDFAGRYQGGSISPGCRTRFKALNRYSRSLPLVNTPAVEPVTGTSLETGIEAGVVNGMKFEIEGYIASAPDSLVIFTGGDAEYFAKRTKTPIFVVCNLVLIGLAAIIEDYDR